MSRHASRSRRGILESVRSGVGFLRTAAWAIINADLITIPVLNVYRKYCGWRVMVYILGVFFVTMAFTGFLMKELFAVLDIVPDLAGG